MAGIRDVILGNEAVCPGHRAYENCKQLTHSGANVVLLHIHTFLHCQSLERVNLPPCLREIRAEAYVGCTVLSSLTLPSHLRYIGHRAFGDCSELAYLIYRRSKRVTWRRPYAAYNAFEACYKLDIPEWE